MYNPDPVEMILGLVGFLALVVFLVAWGMVVVVRSLRRRRQWREQSPYAWRHNNPPPAGTHRATRSPQDDGDGTLDANGQPARPMRVPPEYSR